MAKRKILITGPAGFIGSHIYDYILSITVIDIKFMVLTISREDLY